MKDKYVEVCLLGRAQFLGLSLNVFTQLLNGILQCSPGIVDLIYNEDVLSNQVCVLQRREVEPLSPGDLGTRFLLGAILGNELLVQRKPDSLNRDVGRSRSLQK